MTDTAAIRSATSTAALALGVAGAVAPRTLARVYGAPDPTPEHLYTIRIWGGSTAAIGAVGLMQDGLDDRRFLQMGLALNAFDALVALTAGTSTRSRMLSAATSLGFGAAAAAGLRDD